MNKYIETFNKIDQRYRKHIILIGILLVVIFLAYIKSAYLGDSDAKIVPKQSTNWSITAWQMNGHGGWKEQPVILVDGQKPFYADHPQAYINKIEELYENPAMVRGQFHTTIGELRDGLENGWEAKR